MGGSRRFQGLCAEESLVCVEDDTALRPIGGADLPGEHSSFPAMFESGQSEGLSDATFAQNTISSVRSPETYVSKFYAFRNVRQSSAAGAKELNSISLFFSHSRCGTTEGWWPG
jgi:hypothetical protein